MLACVYDSYGSPEVVRVADVAPPVPRADEIRVRVHAASVTTADWRFRTSTFPGVFWLPGRLLVGVFGPRHRILGMDFSGVVESVGASVTRFRVGDEVFGAAARGAHAEMVVLPESAAVAHKPRRLSHEEAAAVPFGANSALAFLRDFAGVKPGQRVLVVGASGGVGVWAVQHARRLGAHVTGVCSTENVELVRSLGAAEVIDYRRAPYAIAGDGYDVIFDTVGVTTYRRCRAALAPAGIYLPLNSGLREIVQSLTTAITAGRRVKFGISANTREGMEEHARLIDDGLVRPVVDGVYPMRDVAEAHRRVEGRHKRGAVILKMSEDAAPARVRSTSSPRALA